MPSPREQAFLDALRAEPRFKIPYERLLALYLTLSPRRARIRASGPL